MSFKIRLETFLHPVPDSEACDENIYSAYVNSIISKGPRKQITLRLARYNKVLIAEAYLSARIIRLCQPVLPAAADRTIVCSLSVSGRGTCFELYLK